MIVPGNHPGLCPGCKRHTGERALRDCPVDGHLEREGERTAWYAWVDDPAHAPTTSDPSGLVVLLQAPGTPSQVQVLALFDAGDPVPPRPRPAAVHPGQGVLA